MAGREFSDLINGALADLLVRLTIEALRAIRVDFALLLHVRFGSEADVTLLNFDVRFTPESGHSIGTAVMSALGQERTLCAAVRCDILQLANACSQCSWNTRQFHDV